MLELKNLVQRLLILGSGPEVSVEEVDQALGELHASPAAVTAPGILELPLREARDLFEKAYFEHHLEATGGNVTQVAKVSGVERTHLYRKLKALGVDLKHGSGR